MNRNNLITQAVILAAGRGTRMGTLTENTPKPLLKIHGQPILEYTLAKLPPEIKEIIMVIGYLQDQIKNYFGSNFNNKKITYVEQKDLLGTGQALFLCQKLLSNRFMVLMADDIYDSKDLERAKNFERAMFVFQVNDTWKNSGVFGSIQTDQDDNFINIRETKLKPGESGLINTALYVLDQNIFECPLQKIKTKEYGLPQTMLKLHPRFPVKVIKTKFWQPIGTPEQLEFAKKIIKKSP